MPLNLTPTGFTVTYSRNKCAVVFVIAAAAAALMFVIALDFFTGILEGTPLEDLDISRKPAWLYAAITMVGSIGTLAVAIWFGSNAFRSTAAITFDSDGVDARTMIGRRSMRWDEIESASLVEGTLFLHPTADSSARTLPLQTLFTGVDTDELVRAITTRRPDLFGTIGETPP